MRTPPVLTLCTLLALSTLPFQGQAAVMCGVDLNANGYLGDPGETAQCLDVAAAPDSPLWLCPLAATPCLGPCPPPLEPRADGLRCEAPPGCPDGQEYVAASGLCEGGGLAATAPRCDQGALDLERGVCSAAPRYVCPLGENLACHDLGARRWVCSKEPCIDIGVPGGEVEESWSGTMHLEDGARDASGNCLGALYIFSGKNSKCRPPGITVGLVNNCCRNDAEVLSDSTTGVSLSRMVTGVQSAYEMGQVAYYGYRIASGAYTAATVGGQVVVTNVATGGVTASFGATSAVGQGIAGAGQAAAAGAGAQGAVGAGLSSYAGALLNPATIGIAAATFVAMKVLFGSGCGQPDVETALLGGSGYCRYIGTYCEKRWVGIGCVQQARGYCCFNSKMARIIHEQGRPQLKSFGLDGAWGDPKNPNCRGLTPEEFQMLDFSRIDLSEYFGHIQRGLQERLPEARQTIERRIEEHYRMIR